MCLRWCVGRYPLFLETAGGERLDFVLCPRAQPIPGLHKHTCNIFQDMICRKIKTKFACIYIYNILALSLARSCAACVSIHIAAKLQNPKINFPLTNTTGFKRNSHIYIYNFGTGISIMYESYTTRRGVCFRDAKMM